MSGGKPAMVSENGDFQGFSDAGGIWALSFCVEFLIHRIVGGIPVNMPTPFKA